MLHLKYINYYQFSWRTAGTSLTCPAHPSVSSRRSPKRRFPHFYQWLTRNSINFSIWPSPLPGDFKQIKKLNHKHFWRSGKGRASCNHEAPSAARNQAATTHLSMNLHCSPNQSISKRRTSDNLCTGTNRLKGIQPNSRIHSMRIHKMPAMISNIWCSKVKIQ